MLSKGSENYITLKEAAKISGYAPDYIGQLIRKGKLPGKQVYCAVAWTTTEEAMRQYIHKPQIQSKRGDLASKTSEGKLAQSFYKIKTWAKGQIKLTQLYKTALYLSIILSVGFSLILLFIFSVSLDDKLEQRAIQKMEVRSHKAISSI